MNIPHSIAAQIVHGRLIGLKTLAIQKIQSLLDGRGRVVTEAYLPERFRVVGRGGVTCYPIANQVGVHYVGVDLAVYLYDEFTIEELITLLDSLTV